MQNMLNFGLECISPLQRYYTPNQKLACFVLYLKIINIF